MCKLISTGESIRKCQIAGNRGEIVDIDNLINLPERCRNRIEKQLAKFRKSKVYLRKKHYLRVHIERDAITEHLLSPRALEKRKKEREREHRLYGED